MKKIAQRKNQLFIEIEELLERISIPIRYEKGNFKGGICISKNQTMFIINKKLNVDQKLKIARSELKILNLDELYIKTNLREFLEVKE